MCNFGVISSYIHLHVFLDMLEVRSTMLPFVFFIDLGFGFLVPPLLLGSLDKLLYSILFLLLTLYFLNGRN